MRTYVLDGWRYDAMASRRKNGEGSWGTKTINGIKYKFYKDVNGNYFYGKPMQRSTPKRMLIAKSIKMLRKVLKTNYCRQKQRSKISDFQRWNT